MTPSADCFLCGKLIKRQLGFNPAAALNSETRKVLRSLRKSWANSLSKLLDIKLETTRRGLETMSYCLSCHELISNIEFMMSTISRMDSKVRQVKEEVKALLGQRFKKSNLPDRQLVKEILFPEDPLVFDGIPISERTDDIRPIDVVIKPDFPSDLFQLGDDDHRDLESTQPDSPLADPDPKPKKAKVNSQKRARKKITDPSTRSRWCCQICLKELSSRWQLRRHKIECHPTGGEKVVCKFCGKTFDGDARKNDLESHELLHNPGPDPSRNPFFCVLCHLELTSTYELRHHVLSTHESEVFKCDQCDVVRTTAVKLKDHKKRKHLTGVTKMHHCDQCQFQALFPSMLRYHVLSHGEKLFKCDIGDCTRTYYMKNNLGTHQRSAHATALHKFPCTLCPRTFSTPHLLKNHQIHHSTLRPFMCEVCSASFKSSRNLANHRKLHDSKKSNGTNFKPRKGRLTDIRQMKENATVPGENNRLAVADG